MMKALLFCRVSSKEQEETGYSLPAQEKLLKEYSEKKQLITSKIFSLSESASGKKQREIFLEMIRYSEKNNINLIICEKVDRLTRNLKDAVSINDWVNKNPERQVHFVKENFILSKDSRSNEKFIWSIKVSVAQYYIDNLSEEVKKGQIEKVIQGWLPTKPPLGYKTVGGKGHKIHILDEHKSPLVKKMFELYATEMYSLKRLTEIMHTEGLRSNTGKRLCKSRIHQLLHDPFYTGKNRWNGKLYDGKHEPLVTDDLFNLVQKILSGKTTPKYKKHVYLFSGLMRCYECKGTITWEIQRGHIYGHCNHYRNCKQSTWSKQDEVEKKLIEVIASLKIKSIRLNEWIRKALKEHHKDQKKYNEASTNELQQREKQLQKRLDALYDDKLDGKITQQFYDHKYQVYNSELSMLKEKLGKQDKNNVKYIKLGLNFYDLTQKGKEIFLKAKLDQKRFFIKLIFKELYLDEGILTFKFTKAFEILSGISKELNSSKTLIKYKNQENNFELSKEVDTEAQLSSFIAFRPIVLPRLDSNQEP